MKKRFTIHSKKNSDITTLKMMGKSWVKKSNCQKGKNPKTKRLGNVLNKIKFILNILLGCPCYRICSSSFRYFSNWLGIDY